MEEKQLCTKHIPNQRWRWWIGEVQWNDQIVFTQWQVTLLVLFFRRCHPSIFNKKKTSTRFSFFSSEVHWSASNSGLLTRTIRDQPDRTRAVWRLEWLTYGRLGYFRQILIWRISEQLSGDYHVDALACLWQFDCKRDDLWPWGRLCLRLALSSTSMTAQRKF